MTITIVGTGFVGVVTAAVFAKFDHRVIGLDIDQNKIDQLNQGNIPFYEPGLQELIKKGLKTNNLSFTTEYEAAIPESDIIFITVGTPSAPDGTADLTYVKKATQSIAPLLKEKAIVVLKSTVPPGSNDQIKDIISQQSQVKFAVASVPEFLREGQAVQDTLKPDRIIIGADTPWAQDILVKLHQPFPGKKIVISPESAQMAKYTANAYLAQRITFINQIANLCEKNGAHIEEVIEAIGEDKRIGTHYWYPGLGYGGSCFPKDVKELAAYARSVGEGSSLMIKIDQLNDERIQKKLTQFDQTVSGFQNKTVAVLGLSFKPHTNDMREAPSLKVIPFLQKKNATIKVYDPKAIEEAKQHFPNLFYAKDPYEAIEHADVIMHLIEWPELIKLKPSTIAQKANNGAWFIDTRNQFSRHAIKEVGLKYLGIGNPS